MHVCPTRPAVQIYGTVEVICNVGKFASLVLTSDKTFPFGNLLSWHSEIEP